MKKITDSFIFQQVVKNEAVKSAIKNVVINKHEVKPTAFEDQLSIINKRMRYAGKDKVMELYNKGVLIPIYNPTLGIPKYLNTFLRADGSKVISVCDITNFSRINTEGYADITAKTLFTLLQNGAVNYEVVNNWNKYTTNVNIIKNGAIIYSKLFGKVLDKLYAIKVDPFKDDLVHFLLAKFFIVNMCDRVPTETVDRIAFHAATKGSSYNLIVAEANQLNENAFDDIEMFIKALSTLNMKNLNIRIVVENFARMYGEATLLGIDYLPAFLNIIFGVSVQGSIVKDYVIDGICGKQIESLYIEFFKLTK